MSNYVKTTNFAQKDALPSGSAAKKILGSEVGAEFDNIATASATKIDKPSGSSAGDVLVYRSGAWTNSPILPIGIVLPYAGSSEPTDWFFCDGRAISRTVYSELFAILSTTFGVGDGSTTFNIPDLRFRVPVGPDDMGTAEGAGSRDSNTTYASGSGNEGSTGGADAHQLALGELPSHNHGLVAGTHFVPNGKVNSPDGSGTVREMPSAYTEMDFANVGSDQHHNNMPPFIVLNQIIRYQ